jgi:ferredoxin-NADP reductase
MERLEPGESVTATGPWGDLFYNPNRPAVFLAGGIGVTPFRGMMRFAADSRVRQPIVLLYTARTPEDLAFRTEFDRIVREHPHFRVEYSVTRPAEATTGWEGRTGRIDEAWIREAVAKLDRPKVYVAGLPRMARETVLLLQERLGFLEEDLEYEYFMGYR